MKKAKAPRVPVLENAFEVNLPKLMRVVRATGDSRVVLDDGEVRTVAMLTERRLAVFLDGRPWVVDIVPVQCLNDRVRPLLKCPRAHEGNFQSLYYRSGELACRHCHTLRYQSTLAATESNRAQLKRKKLLTLLGGTPGQIVVKRQPCKWRKKFRNQLMTLNGLTTLHYSKMRDLLAKRR